MSLHILPVCLEELDKPLGDKSLGEKGDADSPLQKDGHGLVRNPKDVWVRLETVGGGIENYHSRNPSTPVAIKFPAKYLGKVNEEMDISLWRGVSIPPGIAIGTRKATTLRNVNGIRPFETAEGPGMEGLALPFPGDYSKAHSETPNSGFFMPNFSSWRSSHVNPSQRQGSIELL